MHTAILTAAALFASVAATPATAREPARAFDAITAVHDADRGVYCIRSGWGIATTFANRRVRAGECHDNLEWARRGVVFEPVRRRSVALIAARGPAPARRPATATR